MGLKLSMLTAAAALAIAMPAVAQTQSNPDDGLTPAASLEEECPSKASSLG
jgi:hypothetical protein